MFLECWFRSDQPRGRSNEITPLSGGGRSTERSTVGFGPVDRAVDRRHNGQKNDRWPVDRPVDQKSNLGFSRLQRAKFLWVYKYPLLELISPRFQERKIYIFQVFFSNSFLYPVPVNRAVDRWHNGHKNDRWAGRPGGRPEGQKCPFLLPTGRFV